MAYLEDGYYSDRPVAQAMPAERVAFIRKTYGHVAGAILAFAAISAILIRGGFAESIIQTLFAGRAAMFLLMALFIGGGYLAQYWAQASTSRAMQYAGLGLYVLLQVIIFLPMLYIADQSPQFQGTYVIPKAGLATLGIFAGLSMAVFFTGKDFSFLGPILSVAGWLVLALIASSFFFPINLGTWFSFGMVGLAAAFIIYGTSNVMLHYRADQYVGASLQLFASVALMFFYILRIFMSARDR